jgi:hypothetical protein
LGVSFKQACTIHDDCYGHSGANKSSCDSELGNGIALACHQKFKNAPDEGDALAVCYSIAGTYCLAVDQLGGGAFDAAQKSAKEAN